MPRDSKAVFRPLRPSLYERLLQRRDDRYGLALAGANLGDLEHPFLVVVIEVVNLLIITHGVIELHQPFFQARARLIELGAVGPDSDSPGIRLDGRGKVFKAGEDPGLYHRPHVAARRGSRSFGVVIAKLLAAVMVLRIQRRFGDDLRIFRKAIDDLDVL